MFIRKDSHYRIFSFFLWINEFFRKSHFSPVWIALQLQHSGVSNLIKVPSVFAILRGNCVRDIKTFWALSTRKPLWHKLLFKLSHKVWQVTSEGKSFSFWWLNLSACFNRKVCNKMMMRQNPKLNLNNLSFLKHFSFLFFRYMWKQMEGTLFEWSMSQ